MNREIRPADPLSMFELVFPSDLNAHHTMFGGRVVALMDKCAGMCVGRWAHKTPVTASIDAIQFGVPIEQGQMVEIVARIVFVGRTSCVVLVRVYAQDIQSGSKEYCCEGYFTMVCLNEHGKPVEIPMIPIESEQQQQEWNNAREIKNNLLKRRDSQGRRQV